MTNWMLRGLAFAAAMVVLRLFQGALINAWQTQAGLISLVLLLLYVIAVIVWGTLDGRADAKANPDPDRRADLAMTWLVAGLVAGILSGAVAWIIALFYKGIYVGGLINEVTTFAAFTALIIFLPGISGVAVGRWRVDRNAPPAPTHDGTGGRADTDVFAAVRADDSPTGEMPVASNQAQATAPTAVATVERDAPTEVIATTEQESPTEVIRTTEPEAKTETIATTESEASTEVIQLDEDETKTDEVPKKKKD
ncbi:B-4DMT family transporter [Mycobacterium marinum]|uniref:Conserved transmembrane protein n=1 Tax=Mycobacterium marinum (strain ATCC BAA-535 / M) TaxID=216594 RepID=B2HND0_MYCMM|nr:B-4DMT family transporter [Mycobacterium marinum]ACC40628.1 conserved transmembrane protein [Mycobacterium marinum M]MDC8970951.1 B-4DMT family transporter [Mycobacterium marinum]MDC9003873.1 B-4DMT family transporter [Mycobacterium marinum]